MKKSAKRNYRKYYQDPIVVVSGETVSWIKKDSEWAGWTWCIHPRTKKEGWIPDGAIQKSGGEAVVLRDYSAQELNADIGEIFEVIKEEAGWFWCKNQNGEIGWLPIEIF